MRTASAQSFSRSRFLRIEPLKRLWPALALSFVLLGPVAAGAQPEPFDPPSVEVVFQVAPSSRFDRDAAQRDGARPLITTHLAGLGTSYFGFLRWTPLVQRPSPSPGAIGLIVQLADVPQAAGKDKVLRFLARFPGQEVELAPLQVVLYSWARRDLPLNAAGLAQDVRGELSRLFARDDFRRELHDRFLRAIPLATEVDSDNEARRIVVPLRWESLRVSESSVLRVEFEVQGQGAQPRSGIMKISSVQKRARDPHRGGLQGVIAQLDCAPLFLRNLGDWSDDVPALLDRRMLRQSRVFMESYVRGALATEDGLVVRLGRGGS